MTRIRPVQISWGREPSPAARRQHHRRKQRLLLVHATGACPPPIPALLPPRGICAGALAGCGQGPTAPRGWLFPVLWPGRPQLKALAAPAAPAAAVPACTPPRRWAVHAAATTGSFQVRPDAAAGGDCGPPRSRNGPFAGGEMLSACAGDVRRPGRRRAASG
jgi:hypothetical protein